MDPKGKMSAPLMSSDPKFFADRTLGTEPKQAEGLWTAPGTRYMSNIPGGTVGGTSGTQTGAVRMEQMKLDPPPRYAGGRRPGPRAWIATQERYMRLMRYDPADWINVVAMRVDGAACSWVNAALVAIERGQRPPFADWADFRAALIAAFEPVTETEEARKQLRALRQTGRVSVYIQKFQELQCRLPGMNNEEAFSTFLAGLTPHL